MRVKSHYTTFAFLAAMALHAQDAQFEDLEVKNSKVNVGKYEVPIFNGAELERKLRDDKNGAGYVILEKGPGGAIGLRYRHEFTQTEKTNWKVLEKKASAERKDIAKFYTGKTILGVQVGKFKTGNAIGGDALIFLACPKEPAGSGLKIRIFPLVEGIGNTVTISNRCEGDE